MKWTLVLAIVAVCLTVMVSAQNWRQDRRERLQRFRCNRWRQLGCECDTSSEEESAAPPATTTTAAPPTTAAQPVEIEGTAENGCLFNKCVFAQTPDATPCPSPLGDCNIAGAAAGQYKCCEV